jgi:7-cyano-7-deazaguanine synthase
MLNGKCDLSSIKDKRVVLLQSGGLDSCYLACLFSRYRFEEIHHIFVDYGQNARVQELASAQRIVKAYGGVLHQVKIDLPWLEEATLLNGHTVELYDVDRRMGAVKVGTYVPMRNHVLLSIASSLAEVLKIKYIASGLDGSQNVKGEPLGGTTDKHPNFVTKLEQSLTEGSALKHIDKEHFELIVPILGNDKTDTILQGYFINCDFSLSWTCYNDSEKPCGACPSCMDRKLSFEALNLEDPAFKK